MKRAHARIVTFSGIDGAGKSTQIRALEAWLGKAGLRLQVLTFWDHVVMFAHFREFMSHKTFGGDQGIGSPAKPLHRRDKNVTAWPVTAMRLCLYFADALNTRRMVRKIRKDDVDVVIFDRYIYDELANLPLKPGWAREFIRFLQWIVPKPDVAYMIDADPVAALARKPEYPLEFLRSNRDAYLALARLTGDITVIEPLTVEAMALKIREAFLRRLSGPEPGVSGIPALG
jgi:thymidylate kinase